MPTHWAKRGNCIVMNENNKTDRRYQRTHEAILNMAMELALAEGWEKVSVTKLAEKANINRNSFYLHFGTMNDVFDELEARFVEKYRGFVTSTPVLDVMIRQSKYYDAFSNFLKSEVDYVAAISRMGRADQLISKVQKVWMDTYDAELSATERYRNAKELILPYIAGCTLIFFTNWIRDPTGFDIQKNTLFSGEFIEHILTLASNSADTNRGEAKS